MENSKAKQVRLPLHQKLKSLNLYKTNRSTIIDELDDSAFLFYSKTANSFRESRANPNQFKSKHHRS